MGGAKHLILGRLECFVINYIDWDISPDQVVHLGEVTDTTIVGLLERAEDRTTMQISKIAI